MYNGKLIKFKYFVELNAKPKNNEANIKLIKFLSKNLEGHLNYLASFLSPCSALGWVSSHLTW